MRLLFSLVVLVGYAVSLPAAALDPPAMPPANRAMKEFVTSVEKDGSITFRLYAPAAKAVSVVLGYNEPLPLQRSEDGTWSAKTDPLKPNLYDYYFNVDGFRSKSKNSPFDGRRLQGQVLRTVVHDIEHRFQITHTTVQVEVEGCDATDMYCMGQHAASRARE